MPAIKQAVVIAAENSTKLRPFTDTRPKFMIPVFNKPVIEHIVRQLHQAQVENITVVVEHMGDMIENHLESTGMPGITVTHLNGNSPFSIVAQVLQKSAGPVIVAEGDIYAENTLIPEFVGAYRDGDLAVALAENRNPLYHFQAQQDEARTITALTDVIQEIQKPEERVLAGCCVLAKDHLPLIENCAARNLGSVLELLQSCLAEKTVMRGIITRTRFVDIDYPWEILAANYLALDFFADEEDGLAIAETATIEDNVVLKGTVRIADDVTVESGSVLNNVDIGRNTRIAANSYVEKSIVGDDCKIGPVGYVRGSCMGNKSGVGMPGEFPVAVSFGGAGFGHHCHAGMGVYGDKSGLNAGAIVTANRAGLTKVKVDGKLISSGWYNLGAFVGDNCRIEANANIMPGRKIGPHAVVGPGVILYRDLPPHQRIVARQPVTYETIYFSTGDETKRVEVKAVPDEACDKIEAYLKDNPSATPQQCADAFGLDPQIVKAVQAGLGD